MFVENIYKVHMWLLSAWLPCDDGVSPVRCITALDLDGAKTYIVYRVSWLDICIDCIVTRLTRGRVHWRKPMLIEDFHFAFGVALLETWAGKRMIIKDGRETRRHMFPPLPRCIVATIGAIEVTDFVNTYVDDVWCYTLREVVMMMYLLNKIDKSSLIKFLYNEPDLEIMLDTVGMENVVIKFNQILDMKKV